MAINFGVYAADGSFRVTVVPGTSYTGFYAADGSINVKVSNGTTDRGIYHPTSGAILVTLRASAGSSVYAPDGSLYVSTSPYVSGSQRVTVVSGSLGSGSPYSLVAGLGSFILSGENMTPLVDYKLPSAVGAFTFTGQAATLTYSASATYTGPGDIVSGATTWASPARAYSAAFAATAAPIMDLVDQAGANPITINILTTGFADVTAITNWVSANSVSTIKVTKLYDQTGNTNHWTQATLANMPTLTLSALNGLPAVTCASASAQRIDTPQTLTPPSSAGPMTFSAVAKRTANFTTAQSIIGCQPAQAIGIGFTTSASTIGLRYIGITPTLGSVADSSFHAIQGVVSGASSVMAADGTSATGTATGSAPGANQGFRLGRDQGGILPLDGQVMEVGVWISTAFSGGQITSMNTNQHGTSGYNF